MNVVSELMIRPSAFLAHEEEDAALHALIEVLFLRFEIDFRAYAPASIKRRLLHQMCLEKIDRIEAYQARILVDPACLQRLIGALTIHVTEMFRDPRFFRCLREEVFPILRTYSFLRFWVAGCSTGQEVYSLAILLEEEGLYERSRIYATDLNDAVLARARAGIYPLAALRGYTQNYQLAGGTGAFVDYYTSDSENAVIRPALRRHVVFAAHNLVGDASFNEFHVILCRNVMIYFNRALQNRVHRLFFESLLSFGYLGLGKSETIGSSPYEAQYETVAMREKLYRKLA